MVNIGFRDQNGVPYAATSVDLWQGDNARPETNFVEWMPFQVGQARAFPSPESFAKVTTEDQGEGFVRSRSEEELKAGHAIKGPEPHPLFNVPADARVAKLGDFKAGAPETYARCSSRARAPKA